MGNFSVAIEHLDRTVLLHPVGELDMATAPEMDRALRSVDGQRSVVVDLSGLTFVDCAGLRPLVRALDEHDDDVTSVRFFAARPPVERVLALLGLSRRVGSDGPPERMADF